VWFQPFLLRVALVRMGCTLDALVSFFVGHSIKLSSVRGGSAVPLAFSCTCTAVGVSAASRGLGNKIWRFYPRPGIDPVVGLVIIPTTPQ